MWSKRLPTFNVVGAVALSYLAMSSGHSPGGEEVSAGVAGPTLGPELEPKVTYFLRDKDRDDGGCKEDEQYMRIEAFGDLSNVQRYSLIWRQQDGKCGQEVPSNKRQIFTATFLDEDFEVHSGLSLHACSSYGTYKLEVVIFESQGAGPVTGEFGVKIYRGLCEDTPMWETPLMDSPGQGSYEFPHADSPPLYAGPDPEQASGCEEDNYLGLPADSAPGATLLGCYPDGWNQPALGFGPATTSTMNTAEACEEHCQGYPLFGTMNGDKCACGFTRPTDGEATNCDSPCAGNPKVICGGCSSMTVYARDTDGESTPAMKPAAKPATAGSALRLNADSAPGAELIGCFKDDGLTRVLDGPTKMSTTRMNAKVCSAYCAKYKFFGTKNGNKCFCGDFTPPETTDTCDTPCTGDATVVCGGEKSITIYRTPSNGTGSADGSTSTATSKAASSTSTTPPPDARKPAVVPTLWNSVGDPAFHEKPSLAPTKPKPGDDSASGAKLVGCFKDDRGKRVLNRKSTTSDIGMDAEYCSLFCADFPYFGTQNSNECFCGKMAPEVQSDACSMPCTGRSDVICGGKGAITVFEREGRSSEHIGCYEDSTIDRAMNMATTSNRLMTPEKCRDFCVNEGPEALYFGVEFGTECFCSENKNFLNFFYPIGDSKCNIPCGGDHTRTCGGKNAIDCYQVPPEP